MTFELDADALSVYHPDEGWTVEPGRFDVSVGSSSRDVRLDGSFELAD